MPPALGPGMGQAFHRELAMSSLSHQPDLNFSFSLLQSFLRSPLYRRESTPFPCLGEWSALEEMEPGSPQKRSQPALPTEGNLRRSCGAQAHSPYVMEKWLSPDVQSVPGDFFFPSTACTCVIEPSPTVPEPACSSFLFDLMLSGKRALVPKM